MRSDRAVAIISLSTTRAKSGPPLWRGNTLGIRRPRCSGGARSILAGISLAALMIAPLIGAPGAGATGRPSPTAFGSLSAHATRHCGPVTFTFSPTNPVTYFQVNAIGVSCAVAKHVLVKGGKYHGVPPAGWTYVNAGVMGTSDCFVMWKRGSDRVIAYRQNVNGEGC